MSKEVILGYCKNIVGYNENVDGVLKVLENSGRIDNITPLLRKPIAALVWKSVANRFPMGKRVVYESDLDFAVDFFLKNLNDFE